MTYEQFTAEARLMIANARARFWDMAEPLLTDDATRAQAKSFAEAIGECSPEDALVALRRWKAEHGTADLR